MDDEVVSIHNVSGIFVARNQIIRTPAVQRLYSQRYRKDHSTGSVSQKDSLGTMHPGMPTHVEVEIRRIHAEGNPARGGYGLFTRRGGVGTRAGEIIGEYVGEVRDESNRRSMTRISFETESIGRFKEAEVAGQRPANAIFASETLTNTHDDQYAVMLDNSMDWVAHPKQPSSSAAGGVRWHDDILSVDARLHRNECAFINDARTEFPRGLSRTLIPSNERRPNVKFVEMLVFGWPHMFVQATSDISPDTELLLDYGCDYWEFQGVRF
jgi:hypothetical protein